ncbi:hypothetical protein D3C74_213790 [compost metagenome]
MREMMISVPGVIAEGIGQAGRLARLGVMELALIIGVAQRVQQVSPAAVQRFEQKQRNLDFPLVVC